MTEDEFLAAIRAAPDDDLPRLAFADWLEDRDPLRSIYIRDMIASARRRTFPEGEGAVEVLMVPQYLESPGSDAPRPTVLVEPPIPGVSFTVCRGFVSGVRCSLSLWWAGKCVYCDGGGVTGATEEAWRRTGEHTAPCQACLGTGQAPGQAARILRGRPITRVTLSDKQPGRSNYEGDRWSWWVTSNYANQGMHTHVLPIELFGDPGPVDFDTEDDATNWLSEQLLKRVSV